jgi:amino acid transporter
MNIRHESVSFLKVRNITRPLGVLIRRNFWRIVLCAHPSHNEIATAAGSANLRADRCDSLRLRFRLESARASAHPLNFARDSLHAGQRDLTKLPPGSEPPHAEAAARAIHLPPERRLSLFALICVAYFATSGGAFGIEPLVGDVGPGWAFLLILVTPFVWSLPMALMVAELATLMPDEGGYYIWVRETLGPFWAVQEAWWTMAYSVALTAIFPVLFVSYLTFFIPALASAQHGALIRWLVAVAVVVTATLVNLRGALDVGRWAKASAIFVVSAFVVLVLTWLRRGPGPHVAVSVVASDLSAHHAGALLLGLSTIVFNYGGWDNLSTFAGEVDQPQRNYPRAIAVALSVAVVGYIFPVLAGVSFTADPQVWNADAGWPVIAQLIGGRWLGTLIAAAGLVSMWNLFNAQLLYVSRLPYVMARDGWLPSVFAKLSSDASAPKVAILIIGGLTAIFAALSFGSLALIQCLLYTAGLALEYLALIILRVRRPRAHRSFRVPGGWWGLAYVCIAPAAAGVVVLVATLREWRSFPGQLVVVAFIVSSGLALYFVRRRFTRAQSLAAEEDIS